LVCAYAVVRRTTPVTPGKSDRMTACHSAPARGAVTSRVRSTLSGGQTGWHSAGGCEHRRNPDRARETIPVNTWAWPKLQLVDEWPPC
jgi:hypothetical protein